MIDWQTYLSPLRVFETDSTAGKGADLRNAFDCDLGRVIFCPAIRRMHDKTQVIPLSGGDTVLTRLTHSMQVMSVAESLANDYTRSDSFRQSYKENSVSLANSISAIVRTAALLHDIGNPPFRHFGEVSIQDYFKTPSAILKCANVRDLDNMNDFTEFDGNAMGLRIMSKLQYTGRLDGLNLTYATMAAYIKYPNLGSAQKNAYVGYHKHGIFKTEEPLFNAIVNNCNMRRKDETIKRHPLSFLVEAADSICYGAMDIEDAFSQGWYSYDTLVEELSRLAYCKMESKTKDSERVKNAMVFDSEKKKSKFSIEKFLGCERHWKDKSPKDNRRLILDFRVKLINYLVEHTVKVFCANLEEIDRGSYDKELLKDDPFCINDAISDFTYRYIISHPSVQKMEIKGQSVITGLLDKLIFYAFHENKKYLAKIKGVISEARIECAMHENMYSEETFFKFIDHPYLDFNVNKLDKYSRLRLIVDFVASMTDKFSVELYQRLSGIII